MAEARWMEDFALIRRDVHGDLVTPEDPRAQHRDHLAWLTRAIAEPHHGRTVIVTHHQPSPAIGGRISPVSPFFISNLDNWILEHRPNLWLCGHAHRRLQARVGPTAIRDISFGYPHEVLPQQEAGLLRRGLIDTDLPELLVH